VPLEFGTDGVRGVAHVELTTPLVTALGRAAARVLGNGTWLIGRDTRQSGPSLAAALAEGLASEGAEVIDVGVLPTPAVAFLSEVRSVPAAVISASHNAYTDNGIKLFRAGGRKLTDDVEEQLEGELRTLVAPGAPTPPVASLASVAERLLTDPDPTTAYVAHLVSALEDRHLDGLRVVLDCANGAASALAPAVLAAFG
jgi:phosphoglucosamine mutase